MRELVGAVHMCMPSADAAAKARKKTSEPVDTIEFQEGAGT